MAPLHNRMPAILNPEKEKQWINPTLSIPEALAFLEPYPSDLMDAYTVSKNVNAVKNNDPELIKKHTYIAPPKQGSLFD